MCIAVGLVAMTYDKTRRLEGCVGEELLSSDSTVMMRKRSPSRPMSVKPGMDPVLLVLAGCRIGQIIVLPLGNNTIGRGREADIRLEDHDVSRRHARLRIDTWGQLELLDLGSTNGTFINGERITTEGLRMGDRIRLGPIVLLEFGYLSGHGRAARPLGEQAGPSPASRGRVLPLWSASQERKTQRSDSE